MTTRWSLVVASREAESPVARAALSSLCESYWYPLYAFLRRRGQDADDAADLVQGFFARLIERDDIGRADAERGRFRTYLLTALTRYASNVDASERALKRGGGVRTVPLELADERDAAERRYALEPVDEQTPEHLFDAAWARALLARVLMRLETDEAVRGRAAAFALFAPRLFGDADALSLAEVARRLGSTEGAVKVALHRLRSRYRTLLMSEVAGTVEDPDEVERELRALFTALDGSRRSDSSTDSL